MKTIKVIDAGELVMAGVVTPTGNANEYVYTDDVEGAVMALLSRHRNVDGVWTTTGHGIETETTMPASVEELIRSLTAPVASSDSSMSVLVSKRNNLSKLLADIERKIAALTAASGSDGVVNDLAQFDNNEKVFTWNVVKQASGIFVIVETMPVVAVGRLIGQLQFRIDLVAKTVLVTNLDGETRVLDGVEFEAPHVSKGGRVCLGTYEDNVNAAFDAKSAFGVFSHVYDCITHPNMSDNWGKVSLAWEAVEGE